MDKRIKILIGILALGIILIGGFWIWNNYQPIEESEEQQVTIITDKTEYEQGEEIKITIKNNLEKGIYFHTSFIMPFSTIFLEGYKDGKWLDCDELNCNIYGLAFVAGDQSPYIKMKTATRLVPGDEFSFTTWWTVGEDLNFTVAEKYRFRLEYYSEKISKRTTWEEFRTLENAAYSNEFTIKEKEVDVTADWKTSFLSPKEAEQWKIGTTHTIEINQPVKDFYPFTHLTLNKPNGEEVGIISCKIGTREGESGKTIFNWDTKILLNYCGAGLKEKIKKIEQGTYMIAITKDVEERPIMASSELFSIVPE